MWNLNGWTNDNKALKGDIIKLINSDVICLTETHLQGKQEISIENYSYFGLNRQSFHFKARKASGGVGICIKNSVLLKYQKSVISDSFEGILAIKLNHKVSEYSFVVVCTYVPPESSSWGKDCEAFFSHLMSIVYLTIHCDLLVICGDQYTDWV